MIHIRHFVSERDGKNPNWKAAEDWINGVMADAPFGGNTPGVLHIKAYPTGALHNLVVMMEDGKHPEKKV